MPWNVSERSLALSAVGGSFHIDCCMSSVITFVGCKSSPWLKNFGVLVPEGGDFLQMRAAYHVTGRAGDQDLDFTAKGAAETFRGR